MRREAGSYCCATRITDPLMANAVLVPGKQQRIDINDLHVALAHLHVEALRKTASQHGVEVVGELVPCAGCSEAKGRRMRVPRSTNSRSTKPFQRLFVDLPRKRPASSGGHYYLMMIVDDFSRFGWTSSRRSPTCPLFSLVFWPTFRRRAPHPLWSDCAQTTALNSPRVRP